MTKVPLTIYDGQGNCTVIGEAEVDQVDNEWVVTGKINHPDYKHLLRDNMNSENTPVDYAITFKGSIPVEAIEVPIPAEEAAD